MNLGELRAELRHFAAERDWQPFHTPKNLSTALMVEAAELAEIFQWQTPEESRRAHEDAGTRQRIGEEVADVLLYLLQVADHCHIDLERAVHDKLAKNAVKHPARREIARVSPRRASAPGTHVLLDYENVQPSDAELRTLVPDAAEVWVFHGPHQREVEKRFSSFGTAATAVPISQSGKNALDFHLSFYMGYIASRNPQAAMVVVANDKGYEPMLAHACALGFRVRRQAHVAVNAAAKKTAVKLASVDKAPSKNRKASEGAVQKSAGKKTATKKAPAATAKAKKAAASAPAAKTGSTTAVVPATLVVGSKPSATSPAVAGPVPPAALPVVNATVGHNVVPASTGPGTTGSVIDVGRIAGLLQSAGATRPTKASALRRLLKSLLAVEAGDVAIEVALGRLVDAGFIAMETCSDVRYPKF